jgi:hypothetical protein
VAAPRSLGPLRANGPSSQVVIAGAYAWAVTVAPVIASRGASIGAKVAGVFALGALLAGAAAARSGRGGRSRLASLAGFAGASVAAWVLAPATARPAAIDTLQGLAGMLGWALFAMASAGPALGDRLEANRVVEGPPLDARRKLARGDALYLVGGTAVALALQCIGWGVPEAERALLVRLVALATGLGILGASAEIALARQSPRARRSTGTRWRSAGPALALLVVVALSGLLLTPRG